MRGPDGRFRASPIGRRGPAPPRRNPGSWSPGLVGSVPNTGDLLPRGRDPSVVPDGFHLHHTAGGGLAGQRRRIGEFLKLLLGEKIAVRESGVLILQVDDALPLWLEGTADLVQEDGQGTVIGGFFNPGPG